MTRLARAAATISIILVSGCTSVEYLYPELPLPEPPLLPAMSAAELECVSADTYEKLLLRETRRKNDADTLRAIIIEHNLKAGEKQ